MHPKDAAGIANSVDPDQTAPLWAVWSGSALFTQTYLSENLGSVRYFINIFTAQADPFGIHTKSCSVSNKADFTVTDPAEDVLQEFIEEAAGES